MLVCCGSIKKNIGWVALKAEFHLGKILEARSLRSSCQQDWLADDLSSWLADDYFLVLSSHGLSFVCVLLMTVCPTLNFL